MKGNRRFKAATTRLKRSKDKVIEFINKEV